LYTNLVYVCKTYILANPIRLSESSDIVTLSGIGTSASWKKGCKCNCFLEWAAGAEAEEIMRVVYQIKRHISNYF